MASGRKGQSEITLGAGHIVGMFLAVVVLCGVFFTLGYVMARGGSAGKHFAAGSSGVDATGIPATGNGEPTATGWDFYPAKPSSATGSAGGSITPLTPSAASATQPPASAAAPAPVSGPISMSPRPAGVRMDRTPPRLPTGSQGVLLQVAAMSNRTDALALAGFLKQKGYPAFAWGPSADRLYRVQVGPYADSKQAGRARLALEKEGFKSILR